VNAVGAALTPTVRPSNVDDLPYHRTADRQSPFNAGLTLPLPLPPGLPPQLWAAATAASGPAMLKNPALPYHTGQAVARTPKSTSLPANRGQYPRSPGSVSSSGSGPAAAMSFFAR